MSRYASCITDECLWRFDDECAGVEISFLGVGCRDAVALLLQNKEAMVDEKNAGANTPWLIDLRRHDERALYGHIKGSMHIRGTNMKLYQVNRIGSLER